MTIVEHHSAEELQGLFRQEQDARVAKRILDRLAGPAGTHGTADHGGDRLVATIRANLGAAVQRGRARGIA